MGKPLVGQGFLAGEASLSHSVGQSTFGGSPLAGWSGRRRDLYPTKHNNHTRWTFMPRPRFEPVIATSKRPKTHALDRSAAGISCTFCIWQKYSKQAYSDPGNCKFLSMFGAWCSVVVRLCAELLVGRSRDRLPVVSLDFSVTYFLSTKPWPWGEPCT